MRALRDARQSERHSCMYKYSADAKSHECNRVLRVAPLQAGRMRLQSGRVNEFNNTLQLSKMHVESERHMAVPLTWESERETRLQSTGPAIAQLSPSSSQWNRTPSRRDPDIANQARFIPRR